MEFDSSIFLRTLSLGASATCVAIPLGITTCGVVQRRGWIARAVLLTTAGLIFFPLFLHVSLWDAAFGKLGWLTSARGQVLTPIVSGWTAAAWIHGIAAAPQVALIFLLGTTAGQRTAEEQASLDAGPWQVLWHLKLPRLLPLGLLATLWVIVSCAREIAVTDIYQIGTLAEEVYLGYSLGSVGSVVGNWSADQLASASEFEIGWTLLPFFGLAILTTLGFFRLAVPTPSGDQWQPAKRRPSHRGWATAGVLLMIVTAIVPIGNVLYRCGYCVKPVDGVAAASFSVEQFSESLSRALTDFGSEFFWSTVIAWVAATMILTLAVVIGWLAIARSGWRYVLLLSIAISLTLPGPLVGVTISDLFATVQSSLLIWLYDRTIFAPVLATSIFCWPLAAMLVWYLFSRIDRDSLHSARLDGASWLRQLWHFGVLGNKSALAGAWLLTFALCFGELSATQLVLPPGMDTLPRLMLGLLHAGVDEMTAALTIVISGTVFVLSLLAYAAFRITFWHHT